MLGSVLILLHFRHFKRITPDVLPFDVKPRRYLLLLQLTLIAGQYDEHFCADVGRLVSFEPFVVGTDFDWFQCFVPPSSPRRGNLVSRPRVVWVWPKRLACVYCSVLSCIVLCRVFSCIALLFLLRLLWLSHFYIPKNLIFSPLWRRGSVVRTSVCSRQTFPDLRWSVVDVWPLCG